MNHEPGGHSIGTDAELATRVDTEGRQLSSVALFRGRREIVILHRGQEYRLRITKADKLILTK